MKNLAKKRLLLALAAGVALAVSGVSNADQTQAGTSVQNSATLTYVDLGLLDPATIADLLADPAGTVGGLTGNLQLAVDAPAEFIVDERLDQDLTYDGGAISVTPGGPLAGTFYVAPFTVTNEGNAPIDVVIDAEQLASGSTRPLRAGETDSFDVNNITVYLDNGDGVFNAATDTVVLDPDGAVLQQASIPLGVVADNQGGADITESANQVVGESAQLFLVVETDVNGPGVTNPDANGDTVAPGAFALVELTSTAVDILDPDFNTANTDNAANAIEVADAANTADVGADAVQTVFADGRDPDTEALEIPDAQDRATASFVNQAADFVFTKTDEIICDPINGFADPNGTPSGEAAENQTAAFHIPGAVVRYTITIQNNGNVGALLTLMTDQLQGDISYEPNFIDQDNGTDEDADDIELEDVCDSATDFSVSPDAGATPPDPGNGGGNTAGAGIGIRTILTGPARNRVNYYAPISLNTPPTAPNGAFAIISPPTAGLDPTGDGGGGQLMTFSFATAVQPADGPLAGDVGTQTPPGQLNAGETLRIQFNARIR